MDGGPTTERAHYIPAHALLGRIFAFGPSYSSRDSAARAAQEWLDGKRGRRGGGHGYSASVVRIGPEGSWESVQEVGAA